MGRLIDWLVEGDELGKTYNLVLDNCQDFAQRLFETIAQSKKYPNKIKTTKAILESMKAERDAKRQT